MKKKQNHGEQDHRETRAQRQRKSRFPVRIGINNVGSNDFVSQSSRGEKTGGGIPMLARFTLAVLVAVGFSLHAGAADLAAIKRVIRKELAYQAKPKYCLLVFGKKADTHVWMVRDGNNFYVDTNGNGDLTEPGEKVAARGS